MTVTETMKKYFQLFLFLCLLTYSLVSLADNIVKLDIRGVNDELKKNIEARLDVDSLKNQSPTDIKQFFLDSPNEVKKAIEPFGYFKSHVSYTLTQQQNNWFAAFDTQPGPPILIRHIDLQLSGAGANDAAFEKLIKNFALHEHQVFSAATYEQEKNKLVNLAAERGYYLATVEDAEVLIDLQHYYVDIKLHFNTGPRYRFGDILFNKTALSEAFLRRFAPFKPGDPYNAEKIRTFQNNLNSSDYFTESSVEPDFTGAQNQAVPVKVNLKPVPLRQYNFGLGFGTDTGPRGALGFIWKPTTSSAQYFKTEGQVSMVSSNLQADYIIPGKNPVTDQYRLSGALQQQDIGAGKSASQKITASYSHDVNGWKRTLALSLQRERSTLEDNVTYQTQVMLLPSVNWAKIVKDDPIRPTRGRSINIKILGTPGLWGNTAFLQTQLDYKQIFPILQKDRILLRGSVGRTFTQNAEKLPLSFQYYGGGSQSIRGYAYNSIGPGSNLLIGSAEYRRHITGDWYAAAFIDAGSIDNTIAQDFKKGIGLGVVWQSPIGALELTVAQAQDTPGKPLTIQFSMGPDL
jgi:translocation and assembly module TamA